MENKQTNIIIREYRELFPCKTFSSQWWAYIAMALIWAPALLSPFIGGVRAFFGDTIKEVFIIVAYLIPILLGLKYIVSKLTAKEVVFYVCCVLVYMFNFILYPANISYLEENLPTTFFEVFPMIFVGSFLQKNKILKLLFYCSCLAVLWNYYYYVHVVVSSDYKGTAEFISENMTQSYACLPHVLMVLWQTLKEPKLWKIGFSILAILLVFGFGTRGPLLCTGVFIATYLFFFKRYNHHVLARVGSIAGLILFIVFINSIFEYVGGYIEQMGLSTRIFEYFTGSGLDDANGRDYLKMFLRPYLDSLPFGGYGIWGTYPIIGVYPHDLVWDMMLTFGYLGVVFLFLLAVFVLASLKMSGNDDKRAFICILVCGPAILKLMLSGSFMMEPYFFLLIGYCLSIISHKHKVAAIRSDYGFYEQTHGLKS